MYEFTSHHLLRDADLEMRLRETFERVANAPNASPATASLMHADGALRTFTATFESFEEARTFRSLLASDAEADSHVTPRLEDLEPAAPARLESVWSEPPPAASPA